jgi:hypothetical protein
MEVVHWTSGMTPLAVSAALHVMLIVNGDVLLLKATLVLEL